MSTSNDEKPWTEDENYALLTEILKKARVPSHTLLPLIKEWKADPSWEDIPLPSGRSLKSCRTAYQNIWQTVPSPAVTGPGFHPPQYHVASAPQPAALDPSSNTKKRPYTAERPYLRDIQPRPPGPASYSSETGASTNISPSIGSSTAASEHKKKRGRPTKAVAEQRRLEEEQRRAEEEQLKANAVARGETNHPRGPGSYKVQAPSTPASPLTIQAGGSLYATQTSSRPLNAPPSGYYPPSVTTPVPPGPSDTGRFRSTSNYENIPTPRELPPPQEHRQSLPLPPALQLGPREHMPRIELGDRPYGSTPPERLPFTNSSQRTLFASVPRRPDEPPAPDTQVPLTTTAEKRT
ncbi:hypothetical protein BDV06DRAFT_114458 [Aspergillus oleicola]